MPDDSSKHARPTLAQVVFRIDFSTHLQSFKDSLPQALNDAAKRHFPIQEAKKQGLFLTATIDAKKGSGAMPANIEPSALWQFFGTNREKTLTIAPDHIDMAIKDYPGFPQLRAECADIVGALCDAAPKLTINRMGLRYINLLGGKDGGPFDWDADIEAPFRVSTAIASSNAEVLRAWNTFVMARGDLRITCLYGIRNPDFPAPVVKRQFILDFDAQQHGQNEGPNVMPFLDGAHKEIKDLYEASVTPARRALIGDV